MSSVELKIFHDDVEVGTLTHSGDVDQLSLQYSEAWKKNGFELSPHLPLEGPMSAMALKRFIVNLFPEGRSFDELLEGYRLSRTYTLRILALMGQETTGAFRFSATQGSLNQSHFREIPLAELEERLDQRAQKGIVFWDTKPRLSVAGVQDKLPVLILPDGRMGFGEGQLASTTILKFQSSSERIPHLVLNEFLCMKLASSLGFFVAEVRWQRVGSHPVLYVQRFDRSFHEGRVYRKHVIDGCQALNLPASYKYERNLGSGREVADIREGASFSKLIAFTNQCKTPAQALLQLIDWMLVNLIFGNADAHGKNISYFLDHSGLKPAPAYDLVNITLYPEIDHGLAMAIGDEFEFSNVGAYQLAMFCHENAIPRRLVSQRLGLFLDKLAVASKELSLPEGLSADEQNFVQDFIANINSRSLNLRRAAKEINKVKF